jgi:hypothetical protein
MDPILSALDKLRDELSKAISTQTFRPAPAPSVTEPFTFTDLDGDAIEVRPTHTWANGDERRVLLAEVRPEGDTDRAVYTYLSQGAVNALAQYLDQHRTDLLTENGEFVAAHVKGRARCASLRPVLMDRCELDAGHTGKHRYGGAEWVGPSVRCDRARVGLGQCWLDDGHLGRHRYRGTERDVSTYDEPVSASREHWCGKRSDHVTHLHSNGRLAAVCLGVRGDVYGSDESARHPSLEHCRECGLLGHRMDCSTGRSEAKEGVSTDE